MTAMKRIFGILAVAAASVAMASCTNEKENTTPSAPEVKLVQVEFTASPDVAAAETKTALNGKQVVWVAGDKVSLFSGESFTHTDLEATNVAQDGSTASFTGLAAEGAEEYVAVYPYSEANAYADGVLTVTIPAEQNAVAGGFDPAANVSVAYSADEALAFRNVGALVGISLSESDAPIVTKITIKAKKTEGYYGLAGVASVSCTEDNLPQAGEGSADAVTLLAPADGFQSGVTYYAVVYSGDYAGMEVIYTTDVYIDSTTDEPFDIMRENPTACELGRNQILNIGEIPNACDILPEEDFHILLNFTQGTGKWPFAEAYEKDVIKNYTFISGRYFPGLVQDSDANLYFKFKDKEFKYCYDCHFISGQYEFKSNQILTKKLKVNIPTVPNRYLTGVKVEVRNGSDYPRTVQVLDGSEIIDHGESHSTSPWLGQFETEKGKNYVLYINENSAQVKTFRFYYSKTPYVPAE